MVSNFIGPRCCRGLKKNGKRKKRSQEFVGQNDLVQAIYESARGEALQRFGPPSWARERVRQYGVSGLFVGSEDFPFVISAQSVARPPWSGKRDFHRERLLQAYQLLTNIGPALDQSVREREGYADVLCSAMGHELLPFAQELNEDAHRYLCSSLY